MFNYNIERVDKCMEEKMEELLKQVAELKVQMDKQDEKLDYIVKRLNHMRDKAHAERENKTAWPK